MPPLIVFLVVSFPAKIIKSHDPSKNSSDNFSPFISALAIALSKSFAGFFLFSLRINLPYSNISSTMALNISIIAGSGVESVLPSFCSLIISYVKYWANSKNSIHETSFCLSDSGIPKISDKVNIGNC